MKIAGRVETCFVIDSGFVYDDFRYSVAVGLKAARFTGVIRVNVTGECD